jgi:hypothetical protein
MNTSDLPLPDYDQLPESSVAHRIRSLNADGVRALLDHERAHANRIQVKNVLETRLTELRDGAVVRWFDARRAAGAGAGDGRRFAGGTTAGMFFADHPVVGLRQQPRSRPSRSNWPAWTRSPSRAHELHTLAVLPEGGDLLARPTWPNIAEIIVAVADGALLARRFALPQWVVALATDRSRPSRRSDA